jgi:hypothetical protein
MISLSGVKNRVNLAHGWKLYHKIFQPCDFVGWNDNASKAQNHYSFMPYIQLLAQSGCWCQIQTGRP